MKLRLIKGRSYTDMGSIRADEKHPVIELDDVEKAQSLVDAGFFEMISEAPEKAMAQKAAKKDEEGTGLPYEISEAPTAAETLKKYLEGMTAAQLKKYAAQHGVEVKSSRKEEIIKKLMEADARAQEARESLRGE
jgi:hypothetical protein